MPFCRRHGRVRARTSDTQHRARRTHDVGRQHVLQAADDGRREGRVDVRAPVRRVVEHKTEDGRQTKKHEEHGVGPPGKLHHRAHVAVVVEHHQRRDDDQREQRVVVHEAVRPEALGLKLLLDDDGVQRRKDVVEQRERVAGQVEREVVRGGHERAHDHQQHRHLHAKRRGPSEHHPLERHRHRHGEAPQHREHRQVERLGAAQSRDHVEEREQRQREDVDHDARVEAGEREQAGEAQHVQQQQRHDELTHRQRRVRREVVHGQDDLIHEDDEQRRRRVQQCRRHLASQASHLSSGARVRALGTLRLHHWCRGVAPCQSPSGRAIELGQVVRA
eukprot:Unigene12255_Nuclearia_a/m.37249 Unigene12255_Nuclearia_a/g.37249  ORF Unigene12255_Nuclearia_a/g.37249 Unigene12255_Nuclearia_a/m.37249 type:complete len:333 (+) Unigene12255_Nuclearia_a:377-1375(+)